MIAQEIAYNKVIEITFEAQPTWTDVYIENNDLRVKMYYFPFNGT